MKTYMCGNEYFKLYYLGFADRCHELESQLEILIDKFKGEKMAGKMARQEKNLNDTIKLINSLEQKLVSFVESSLSQSHIQVSG